MSPAEWYATEGCTLTADQVSKKVRELYIKSGVEYKFPSQLSKAVMHALSDDGRDYIILSAQLAMKLLCGEKGGVIQDPDYALMKCGVPLFDWPDHNLIPPEQFAIPPTWGATARAAAIRQREWSKIQAALQGMEDDASDSFRRTAHFDWPAIEAQVKRLFV